jgi:hypothetical protein
MSIVVLWFVMPCSFVGHYQGFGEMLVTTFKTTWHHKPEDHNHIHVRFEVFAAVSTKMAVFWVALLMMEAVRTSETLVNFYQTTWCDNPEDSHLHHIRVLILLCFLHFIQSDGKSDI